MRKYMTDEINAISDKSFSQPRMLNCLLLVLDGRALILVMYTVK